MRETIDNDPSQLPSSPSTRAALTKILYVRLRTRRYVCFFFQFSKIPSSRKRFRDACAIMTADPGRREITTWSVHVEERTEAVSTLEKAPHQEKLRESSGASASNYEYKPAMLAWFDRLWSLGLGGDSVLSRWWVRLQDEGTFTDEDEIWFDGLSAELSDSFVGLGSLTNSKLKGWHDSLCLPETMRDQSFQAPFAFIF